MAKSGIGTQKPLRVYDSADTDKGEFNMNDYAKTSDIKLLIEEKFNRFYVWTFSLIILIAGVIISVIKFL